MIYTTVSKLLTVCTYTSLAYAMGNTVIVGYTLYRGVLQINYLTHALVYKKRTLIPNRLKIPVGSQPENFPNPSFIPDP